VEIAPLLKPGANTLEITVDNLPVSPGLGLPNPDLEAHRAVHGARFPAPEEKKLMDQPEPSGLIGRVVLLSTAQS
jgi:hypothetical protein